MHSSRRVVVTGVGLITPLGNSSKSSWEGIKSGKSGIRAITGFDCSDLPCRIAGQIDKSAADYCPEQLIPAKELNRMEDFVTFSLLAAHEAMRDADWVPQTDADKENTGVSLGCGIGGLDGIYQTSSKLLADGPRKVSPFFIPSSLINMAAGHISIRFGLQGPNHSLVTACASSTHAIGDAVRMIACGDVDVMLAGGTEAAVCRVGVAGFSAMRALSTKFNDQPEAASRPWDKERDGFIMGEGAGVLVLESLEHALKRKVKQIYGEIVGYGSSADAYHITAPREDGKGAMLAMKKALHRAQISCADLDYINAHGTSTPLGDDVELAAVQSLYDNGHGHGHGHSYSHSHGHEGHSHGHGHPHSHTHPNTHPHSHAHVATAKGLCMSSTKSATGHLLGAAGAVEAIFTLLAMRDSIVPPTLNLYHPSQETNINLVPHKALEKKIDYALSNSFGFGGTNAAVIFKNLHYRGG